MKQLFSNQRSFKTVFRGGNARNKLRPSALARVLPPVCGLMALVSCAELPPSAKAQLVQAEKDYRAGQYDAARTKLDDVIRTYPSVLETSEAYYLRAQCLANAGQRGAAQSDIDRCLALSQNSEMKSRAQAMAGELAFESGDARKASEHFRTALSNLPERPPYDLARYRYGVCLAQQGDWKNARAQWEAVVNGYTGSTIVGQAQRMLNWPGEYFSIQCGAYRDKASAAKQAQKLRAAGLSARTEVRKRDGESLQMVYVGQYLRLNQAQEALGRVKQQAPGAVIVPQ